MCTFSALRALRLTSVVMSIEHTPLLSIIFGSKATKLNIRTISKNRQNLNQKNPIHLEKSISIGNSGLIKMSLRNSN